MKVAINYSDKKFKKEQKLNTKTAYSIGNFDKVIEYSPEDIDLDFKNKHKNIFQQERGGGYWLWKPYIILKTMNKLSIGDYLFYCDSGTSYINSIDYLIQSLETSNQDIMVFDLPLIEKQWTKMDTFIIMNCEEDKYMSTNQRLASFILIKKTDFSMKFVKEYLKYCCNESIITDSPNMLGKSNDVYFLENRHDQSVLSLLSKKYNLLSFRDPSQFGFEPQFYFKALKDVLMLKGMDVNKLALYEPKEYTTSNYPQILVHYRKEKKIKEKIKKIVPSKIKKLLHKN